MFVLRYPPRAERVSCTMCAVHRLKLGAVGVKHTALGGAGPGGVAGDRGVTGVTYKETADGPSEQCAVSLSEAQAV